MSPLYALKHMAGKSTFAIPSQSIKAYLNPLLLQQIRMNHIDPSALPRPRRKLLSREEKMKLQAAEEDTMTTLTSSSSEKMSSSSTNAQETSKSSTSSQGTAYFEKYSPLTTHRASDIPILFKQDIETPDMSYNRRKQEKKEKEARLKKNLGRRLNSPISHKLAAALESNQIPSLLTSSIHEFDQLYPEGSPNKQNMVSITTGYTPLTQQGDSDPADIHSTPLQWFPGHMAKAMQQLADRIRTINIVVEVRDARAPFSSANPMLESITSDKIRIIVFNKTDLCVKSTGNTKTLPIDVARKLGIYSGNESDFFTRPPHEKMDSVKNPLGDVSSPDAKKLNTERYGRLLVSGSGGPTYPVPYFISKDRRTACIFTYGRNAPTVRALMYLIKEIAPPRKFKTIPTAVVVCGYPNVGKSTLINGLKIGAQVTGAYSSGYGDATNLQSSTGGKTRELYVNKSNAKAKVGPDPGVTRKIHGFKVSDNPPIVILDTPGIMIPRFDRSPAGINASLKIALTGSIADHIAGIDTMVQYLLTQLNKREMYKYVNLFKLPGGKPTNCIATLAFAVSRSQKWSDSHGEEFRREMEMTTYGRALSMPERHKYIKENMTESGILNADDMYLSVSPDIQERAHVYFLKAYREGKLGNFCLDTVK